MIYQYWCPTCAVNHEVWQEINEEHKYRCPVCMETCGRIYNIPKIKKNRGFYSDTLGEYVDSHNEFEEKLCRLRYMSFNSELLGDHYAKDEWIETRETELKKRHKIQDKIDAENEEIRYQAGKEGK